MLSVHQLDQLPYGGKVVNGGGALSVAQLDALPYAGSSVVGLTSETCRQAIHEKGKPFRLRRAQPVPTGITDSRRDRRLMQEVDVSQYVALFDETSITVMTEEFGPLQAGRIRMKTMPDEVTISRLDEIVRLDAFQNALWAGAGSAPLLASGTTDDALPIPYAASIEDAYWYRNGVKHTATPTDYAPTDTGIHWLTGNRPQAGDNVFVQYIPYLAGVVVEDEGRIAGTGADGGRMWQITMLELLRGESK